MTNRITGEEVRSTLLVEGGTVEVLQVGATDDCMGKVDGVVEAKSKSWRICTTRSVCAVVQRRIIGERTKADCSHAMKFVVLFGRRVQCVVAWCRESLGGGGGSPLWLANGGRLSCAATSQ
jgi:hypothetical protein